MGSHLPINLKEVKQRGWEQLDVILFSGDAYVDHPSFGISVIGRVLENLGLKVAIIPQPNWRDDLRDFKKLGVPKLFFGVSAGNMDSMINKYTANKRLRSSDMYSPGGQINFRPDNAVVVYSNILKEIYPDTPLIIGGIEASLRRFTHYDYWENKLKASILIDSKADMLVYGMGEKAIIEIATQLQNNINISDLKNIPQTGYLSNNYTKSESIEYSLFSHDDCLKSKTKFAKNFTIIETQSNLKINHRITQKYKGKTIIINPSYPTSTTKDADAIYDLPYTRLPHPKYQHKKPIPAFDMIKNSVNIHRGCFGGCSFCTISAHQGKFIVSRSEESIMKEIDQIAKMPGFKGYLSDIGGPSANMYKMEGIDLEICKPCKRASCIFPNICKNLNSDHTPLLNLYKKVRKHPKIKKATIGSGVRYDIALLDTKNKSKNIQYLKELIKYHVSGRLKVAPEHSSKKVLDIMRKPSFKYFHELKKIFDSVNKTENLNQQIIPYLISSHPACTNIDMAELSAELKENKILTEPVQDFTPTPMTLATVMFYTGINPYTQEKIYVAKSPKDKLEQQKYFAWYKPENKKKIIAELNKHNRDDLIKKLYNRK